MKRCPDCESEKIVKDVIVLDRGDGNSNHPFRVAVDESPEAIIFKKRSYSDVNADVCAECGFVQFYALNPQSLWIAYQNREKNVS